MKTLLTNSQKTVSAIVALTLGLVITFSAGDSFGVTDKKEKETNMVEMEILERAYADVMAAELEEIEIEKTHTIKVYDNDDNLLKTVELVEGEVIEDEETQRLINQAEFLTEYNDTEIYKISK